MNKFGVVSYTMYLKVKVIGSGAEMKKRFAAKLCPV